MSTKGTGRETPETEAGRKPNGIYCDYVHWTTCARIEQQRDKALAALKGLLEKAKGLSERIYDRDYNCDAEEQTALFISEGIDEMEQTIAAALAAAEPKAEGKG